jgi:hypothetical protein
MNNLMNKIGSYFGQKPIYHYPELYQKHDIYQNFDLNIAVVTSSRIFDPPTSTHSINWKLI